MDNTLYIALSHQAALRRRMDVVANNIANMSTTAYQKETVAFHEYVVNVDTADGPGMGGLSFVQDKGVTYDFRPGQLINTTNDLDLAIAGEGFFSALTEEGEVLYTRNGHFNVNQEGFLANDNGELILDEDGAEIELLPTDTMLTVAADGTLTSERRKIAKIGIFTFENLDKLEKTGNGLYFSPEDPLPAEKFKLAQGMLEGSNVNAIEEMTNMINVHRSYERTSRMMKDVQDMGNTSIKRLGTLKG